MNDRLFNHRVRVTVAAPNQGNTPNATVVTDLRVQFSIEKNLTSTPNKSDVVITNLSKTSRAAFEKKPLTITLETSYDDGPFKRLFMGDLRHGYSKVDGPNWLTTLQLGDGDRAYRYATIDKSYGPNVKKLDMLRDLVTAFKAKLPSTAVATSVFPTSIATSIDFARSYGKGYTMSGTVARELDRLLAMTEYAYSIQDGNVQILEAGRPKPGSGWLINQDAGMIGSPEWSVPEKPGEPVTLTFKVELFAELTPGDLCKVVSRDIEGKNFRIEKVTHKGDTHGEEWASEVEAKPL